MSVRLFALILFVLSSAPHGISAARENQSIALCANDASGLYLAATIDVSSGPEGLRLRGRGQGDFSLAADRSSLNFKIQDFANPYAYLLWEPTGRALALNYSSGGAIGAWHVRVFTLDKGEPREITSNLAPVTADFKSRHSCEARPNNLTALKWLDASRLLLMAEVYPTSDCGVQMGQVEGFVVSVDHGNIERRFTFEQLKRFPGLCFANSESR